MHEYNLFDDIAGHLAYSRRVSREMNDRYLQDFTLAWRGSPDPEKLPEWMMQEWREMQKKANAVSTTIGDGPTRVTDDPDSNIIQIWSSEGAITVQRRDVAALIAVLQRSISGPTVGGATGTPNAATLRSAPELSQNEKVALYLKQKRY